MPRRTVALALALAIVLSLQASAAAGEPTPPSGTARPDAPTAPARLDAQGDPLPAGAVARLGTKRFRVGPGAYRTAFTSDARRVALTRGVEVHLWDTETGLPGPVLRGHIATADPDQAVMCAAFSADGTMVATGAYDQTARLWDAATGKELRTLRGFVGPVWHVAFSPDGRLLATAESLSSHQTRSARETEKSARIRVWEAATGKEIASETGDDALVEGMVGLLFSPDGKSLLRTREREVRVFDPSTMQRTARWKAGGQIETIALSPDGRRLAAAIAGEGRVEVFDVASEKRLEVIDAQRGSVVALAFSPDGKTLGMLGQATVLLHTLGASGPGATRSFPQRGTQTEWGLAFSADGRTLACIVEGDLVRIDVEAGRHVGGRVHGGAVAGVAFAPDGKRVLTGCEDGAARLFDVASGREVLRLADGSCSGVALSPDGRAAVTHQAYLSGLAESPHLALRASPRLWDLTAASPTARVLEGAKGTITAAAFTADGARIVGAGAEDGVLIWERASGKLLQRIDARGGGLSALAVSADGGAAAIALSDVRRPREGESEGDLGEIRIVNLKSGAVERRIPCPDSVVALALSPDGRRLLGGGMFEVAVWDVQSGAKLYKTDDYGGMPVAAFTRDGKRLLVAVQEDLVIRDAETGALLERMRLHEEQVRSVALSADGRLLVTGSEDRTALVRARETGW